MHPPALVVFNDAGGGKNAAGVASLAELEREGIAAAAVSHESARIGDALDAWENGVVSRANGPAAGGGAHARAAAAPSRGTLYDEGEGSLDRTQARRTGAEAITNREKRR